MAAVETVVQGRREHRRVSWGAIFGGTAVALGVWAMLFALGLAVGLSGIHPNESVRGEALFTGIWSILAPLIALFAGGYVAARLAGFADRTTGALHGAVLWGLTLLIGGFVMTTAMSTAVGGVATVGRAAVTGAVGGVGQVGKVLGIQTDDLLAPVNQKLRAQGKSPVTSEQLSQAVQSAAQTSLRQGRLDPEVFENALAQNTGLSRADVRELSGTLGERAQQTLGGVQQAAATAASGIGKAMWGVFFGLLLGLISSVLGAIAGISAFRKEERRRTTFEAPAQRPAEVR